MSLYTQAEDEKKYRLTPVRALAYESHAAHVRRQLVDLIERASLPCNHGPLAVRLFPEVMDLELVGSAV
jgi:hypothetical protein